MDNLDKRWSVCLTWIIKLLSVLYCQTYQDIIKLDKAAINSNVIVGSKWTPILRPHLKVSINKFLESDT